MTPEDENRDNPAPDGVAMPDTGGMDAVMAAGPRSGAAGVANADLGTSGPPASELLSAEEVAATEGFTAGSGETSKASG